MIQNLIQEEKETLHEMQAHSLRVVPPVSKEQSMPGEKAIKERRRQKTPLFYTEPIIKPKKHFFL